MGDLIDLDAARAQRRREEPLPEDRCEGLIHVFPMLPGRCVCGETEWDGAPVHEASTFSEKHET